MSNPIDTRNLATPSIRRVNARTDPEDLNSEGRFDGRAPSKRGGDQAPVALDSDLDLDTRNEHEALRQLNFAISLMQAAISRVGQLSAVIEAGEDEEVLQALVHRPLFQHYELPHGEGAKPTLFPVRLKAVEDEEPYTIVLHPIEIAALIAEDFRQLEIARKNYEEHHEWLCEQLMLRIEGADCDGTDVAYKLSETLCDSLAQRHEAPWNPGRFTNAARLLRRSPTT